MQTCNFTAPRGKVGPNGSLVHHVRVQPANGAPRTLTFTHHSPDRYTVFGLSSLPADGISIERRNGEKSVLMDDSSVQYDLRDVDKWIAYRLIANSYHGVVAVGATPEQAYAKMFQQFSQFR
jgi:hypothetical protein